MMNKLLNAALAALAFACPAPAAAQTVHTSPFELVDNSPGTPGLVINRAVLTPPVARGVAVRPCGRIGGLYAYVRLVDGCPAIAGPAPAVDPWAIAAPRVTTPIENAYANSGSKRASRRTDLHVERAMEAYPFTSAEPLTGVVIADVIADQVRAGVTNRYPAAPVSDLLVERVRWSCTEYCVLLRRDNANVTIRDAKFRPGSADNAYSTGIQLDPTAHDVLIERVDSSGFKSTQPSSYPNADGMVANRGAYNLTVRYSRFDNNTDGGLDLKARNTLLDQVSATGNGRNFRFWDQIRTTVIHSIDPRKAHVWASKGARVTIGRLVARGGAVLIETVAGAEVDVQSCDLTGYTGGRLVKGGGKVTLGEGCKLP